MTTHLIVNVSPQFTIEPTNSTVVEGDTVRLDCAAVGFPAPSILWKKQIYSKNTAGDFAFVHSTPRAHRYTNGTLVISDAEEKDGGAYMCQANNGIGATLSKIVHLEVLAPPRFKESFQSQSTREGLNTTLKCDATGHTPITITWQKNKTVLDSKSNESAVTAVDATHISSNPSTDPNFLEISPGELEVVIHNTKLKKASGLDGIPGEIVKEIYYANPEWFRTLLNNLLRNGEFPTAWKTARIAVIPKDNRDLTHPKDFRPIIPPITLTLRFPIRLYRLRYLQQGIVIEQHLDNFKDLEERPKFESPWNKTKFE
ncbi:down syndrome cell adhesion molecule-like protein Dscam2 [Caerostris darwini]|uniref:Down syndrome cell adhesion molecule-like protein Dscam2 n=1 Tax=Caerostris darwini TaxID=1538125 RepID=A0AAV4VE34_9ARAC|nr:down syndrome cell adhesion molecule-like protein Dscam2 [Caerostris darwini]